MKKTNNQTNILAKKYHCTARTIRVWKREGAPLDDPGAMRIWLAGRKNIPPRLPVSDEGRATADNTPQLLGAAAALVRLEQAEVLAYQKLQRAIGSDDVLAIRMARDSWLKIAESLRHYERAVTAEKRARNELVPRGEIEDALKFFSWAMRISFEASLPRLALTIQGEPDMIRARQILRRAGWYFQMSGLAALYAKKIPKWIIRAFSQDLDNELKPPISPDCELMGEKLREVLSELGEFVGERAVTDTPPAPPDVKDGKISANKELISKPPTLPDTKPIPAAI